MKFVGSKQNTACCMVGIDKQMRTDITASNVVFCIQEYESFSVNVK